MKPQLTVQTSPQTLIRDPTPSTELTIHSETLIYINSSVQVCNPLSPRLVEDPCPDP